MKKIVFLFIALFSIIFSGCNPLDDTYNQLDANSLGYRKEFSITLTEAQYKSFKDKPGVNSYVNTNYYFVSDVEAGAIIPSLLSSTYPQLDNGSYITVNYNYLLYNFKGANRVNVNAKYTLVATDYSSNGFTFGNLTTFADVVKILNFKYPAIAEYDQVLLTYQQYDSNVASSAFTVTNAYYYINGAYAQAYLVSGADYISVGRGRYLNFIASDVPNLSGYFNKFLKNSATLLPVKGDVKLVSYNYFSGSAAQKIMAMYYDGTNWLEVTKPVTENRALAFSKVDGVWKPDLTLRYTMVAADYSYIAGNAALGNATNRANLASYGNFSHRVVTDPTYWTDAQINEAIGAVLIRNFPTSTVGQKYQVTYSQYIGTTVNAVRTYILLANGTYSEVI